MRTTPPNIPEDQVEKMFKYWHLKNGNIAATAREFSVNRQTVNLLISRYRWKARSEALSEKIRKANDRSFVAGATTNLDTVKRMLEKQLKAYDGKEAVGRHREVMDLIRYVDEVQGNIPASQSAKDRRTAAQEAEILAALRELDEAQESITDDEGSEESDADGN